MPPREKWYPMGPGPTTAGAASYSPYRGGGGGGSPPFANSGGSGMTLTAGPFGAYVSMHVGGF